jgi:hypothetical protein
MAIVSIKSEKPIIITHFSFEEFPYDPFFIHSPSRVHPD